MDTVILKDKGLHVVAVLNRPKAHALNLTLVEDLRTAFASLHENDAVEGVILNAEGKIFSAGLDVVELFSYDEAKINLFWEKFGLLVRELAGFPKPVIAAINGHAPAGGCVLALCCDYRLMAEGTHRIGLNEVPVAVTPPAPVIELARHAVGDAKAGRMMLNGLLMTPDEALDFGLIDEVCPAENLLTRAEEKLTEWTNLPQAAWRHAKAVVKAPLLERLNIDFAAAFGETNRGWWDKKNRAAVEKMVQRLSSKK